MRNLTFAVRMITGLISLCVFAPATAYGILPVFRLESAMPHTLAAFTGFLAFFFLFLIASYLDKPEPRTRKQSDRLWANARANAGTMRR